MRVNDTMCVIDTKIDPIPPTNHRLQENLVQVMMTVRVLYFCCARMDFQIAKLVIVLGSFELCAFSCPKQSPNVSKLLLINLVLVLVLLLLQVVWCSISWESAATTTTTTLQATKSLGSSRRSDPGWWCSTASTTAPSLLWTAGEEVVAWRMRRRRTTTTAAGMVSVEAISVPTSSASPCQVMTAAWPTAVPVVATSATRSCSGTFHIPAMSASCSPSPLPLAYPTAPTATRCLCTPPLVWNPLLCCHEMLPAYCCCCCCCRICPQDNLREASQVYLIISCNVMWKRHWESVQCWCYSCEEVAPCLLWGTGLHKTDHCNATVSSWLWLKNKVSIFPLIQPNAAICLHCVIPLLVLGVAACSNCPWKNEAVGSCPFVSLLEALVPTWIFQLKLFSSPITMQVQQNESSSVDEATAGGLMTTSVSARPSSMSGFSHGLYGPASFCSLPLCGSLEDADNCPLTLHEESADTDSCFPSCSPTSSIAFAHSRPRSDPSTDSQYVHTYMDTHSPSILFRFFHSQYSIIKEQQECIKVHACMHSCSSCVCKSQQFWLLQIMQNSCWWKKNFGCAAALSLEQYRFLWRQDTLTSP